MPQALSKFERPASRLVAMAAGEVQKKKKNPSYSRWKKCKHPESKLPPIVDRTFYLRAPEEEDWEKEIEDYSRTVEKEKAKKMPYDPEDVLKVGMDEMSLYAVPRAPTPNQDHYSPSKHHVPPVKWTRYICARVVDQFADAEE